MSNPIFEFSKIYKIFGKYQNLYININSNFKLYMIKNYKFEILFQKFKNILGNYFQNISKILCSAFGFDSFVKKLNKKNNN